MPTFDRGQVSAEATRRALEEVRRIVLESLRGTGAVAILFGSFAKGRPSPVSDVDVAIDSETPLPAGALSEVRERLEESHVPYRVEIVDLSRTDEAFRARVLREGVRWSG